MESPDSEAYYTMLPSSRRRSLRFFCLTDQAGRGVVIIIAALPLLLYHTDVVGSFFCLLQCNILYR